MKPDDVRYLGIRRGHWLVIALIVLCGLALICIPHVRGENITGDINGSFILVGEDDVNITNTPTPIPTNLVVGRRIMQGDCVAIGETVDIAGIGWYSGKIMYYGRYYDGFVGDNLSWQAERTVSSQELDHLYIDPQFFSDKTGWWYTPSSFDGYFSSSNDRLFKVEYTCDRKVEIQREVQIALNESQERAALIANASVLPVRTESGIDLILNKNLDTVMDAPNDTETYWMFGTETPSALYDRKVVAGNLISFDSETTASLPSETYDVILIRPGRNGIIEETYNSVNNSISSPFREQKDVSLVGISSSVAKTFLEVQISKSRDDTSLQWHIDLQDPRIYVMKLIQNPLPNNQSLIILAGYTNENQGAVLNIALDADSANPKRTFGNSWNATVINRGGQVAYRVWNTSFIMDFNEVVPGPHSFTVTSPSGGSATIPIYRRAELAGHYQPPGEIAYWDNSPFIPTPTPKVEVQIQQVKVVETVIVPVTPTDEQVRKAADASNAELLKVSLIIIVVVGVSTIVLFLLAKWLMRVYRRAKL